jgi:predicted ester cyclase
MRKKGSSLMSTETNKVIVRRWVKAVNEQNGTELDAVMAPAQAQEWQQNVLPWVYSTFAGHQIEITKILAEGDQVAIWVTTRGRHTGEFQGVPATGRSWTNQGVFRLRLLDSKIVEAAWLFDNLNLLQQVGATVALVS